jgi:hypothetical protein
VSDPLDLPRNAPVWLPLLAESLAREKPDFLWYISPAESRDILALYEAWRSRAAPACRILCVSVHPHLPPEERLRQLYAAATELVPAPDRLDHSRFAGQVSGWQRLERAILDLPPAEVWEWYAALRQAVNVYASLPPLPGAGPPAPAPAAGRLALFGDWLLDRALVDFIGQTHWRIALIQPLFDLVDWSGDVHPDEAWADHPSFQPVFSKMDRYQALFEEREISAVILVTASFSPHVTVLRRFAGDLTCPALLMESEIPGGLSEQNRIRLENFLQGSARARHTSPG